VLLQLSNKYPVPENIIKLLDHFELMGPNGSHLCVVLELMWVDVGTFMGAQYSSEVRMSAGREIAMQILRSLEVLRSYGITHNGTLSLKHT
jgi:serine/threonine-protein kinase SRPK3